MFVDIDVKVTVCTSVAHKQGMQWAQVNQSSRKKLLLSFSRRWGVGWFTSISRENMNSIEMFESHILLNLEWRKTETICVVNQQMKIRFDSTTSAMFLSNTAHWNQTRMRCTTATVKSRQYQKLYTEGPGCSTCLLPNRVNQTQPKM